jgi:hypothetical protein
VIFLIICSLIEDYSYTNIFTTIVFIYCEIYGLLVFVPVEFHTENSLFVQAGVGEYVEILV